MSVAPEMAEKIRALITAFGSNDMAIELIVDVVARGLGKLGGRPKKPDTNPLETGSEPVRQAVQAAQPITPAPVISHSKPPPPIAPSPPSSDGGFGGSLSSAPGLLRLSGDPEPLEARSKRDVDVMRVLEHYQRLHPQSRLTEKSKEARLIRERMAEGYTVEQLCRAIDGYHRSPHHQGENDRRTKYLSLELFVRDSKHVQAGIEFVDRPMPLPSKNGATVAAVLAMNARRP